MKVFDNSNLNESYAGIVSPMTFSFISRVYRQVYIQFCRLFGVSEYDIISHDDMFSHMLAHIGGRAYYQLHNWHRMFLLFPGYSFNGKFLEDMMGIPSQLQGKVGIQPKRRSVWAYGYQVYIALCMVWIFLTMGWRIRQFSIRFRKKFETGKKRLLSGIISSDDLIARHRIYEEIEADLTKDFSTAIANDMAVMISSGIFKLLCTKWLGKNGEAYAYSMTGGTLGLKSAKPGRELLELIQLIRCDTAVGQYMLKHSAVQSLAYLKNNIRNRNLWTSFCRYLDEYGSRIPGELKLESVSFADNPSILMRLIRSNLGKREIHMDTALPEKSGRLTGLNPVQNAVLKTVKIWLDTSVRRRELTRFYRTRIFDLARQYINLAGYFLHTGGYIDDPKDVYFLPIDAFGSRLTPGSCRKIVGERRKKESYYRTLTMPRRIVSESDSIDLKTFEKGQTGKTSRSIAGTIACRGTAGTSVTGEALVLTAFDPSAVYAGKILVTRQTDPGWTIVFPLVKAIVVERGGMLSHAAIISRELGIPCIMGVEGATDMIRSGARITIDMAHSRVGL